MKPVIQKQGPYLITCFQPELTDTELLELQDALVEQVGRYRSRGVILDVTALDIMDSFATRTLRNIAQAAELRGAKTVIVGIQPEVAFAMVELGLDSRFSRVQTTLDLEEALVLLDRQHKRKGRRG